MSEEALRRRWLALKHTPHGSESDERDRVDQVATWIAANNGVKRDFLRARAILAMLFLHAVTACNGPSRRDAEPAQAAVPMATAIATPMPDCEPRSRRTTRTGRIEVAKADARPHGKQFLGARLIDAEGKRWVVTYSSGGGPFGPLDGRRIEVTGWSCSPQHQALIGQDHFLVETLRVLP